MADTATSSWCGKVEHVSGAARASLETSVRKGKRCFSAAVREEQENVGETIPREGSPSARVGIHLRGRLGGQLWPPQGQPTPPKRPSGWRGTLLSP